MCLFKEKCMLLTKLKICYYNNYFHSNLNCTARAFLMKGWVYIKRCEVVGNSHNANS